MKSLAWLGVLLIAGSVVLCGSSNAFAQEPGWYDDLYTGCGFKAQWSIDPNPGNCDYTTCDPDAQDDCVALVNDEDINVVVDVDTVTVRVWNWFIKEQEKEVYIRVEGTGASDVPLGVNVAGNNDVLDRPVYPESYVEIVGVPDVGNDTGAWWVEVHAIIRPQPHEDVLVFQVPGIDAGGAVTEVWAWSDCTGRTDIPTVTEWGVTVMTLLLLSAATVVLVRRRVAVV